MKKSFKKMLVYFLVIAILFSWAPSSLASDYEESPFINNQSAQFAAKTAGASITFECDSNAGGNVTVTMRYKTPEGWASSMQTNMNEVSAGHFICKAMVPSNAATIQEVVFKVETANGKSTSASIKYTNFKIAESGLVIIFPQKIFDTVGDNMMSLLVEASDGSRTVTFVDKEDLPDRQKTFSGLKPGLCKITLRVYTSRDDYNNQYGNILATATANVTDGVTKVTLGEYNKLSNLKNIKVIIKTAEGAIYNDCNVQLYINEENAQTGVLGGQSGYFIDIDKIGNLVISVTPFDINAYNEYVFPELSKEYALKDDGTLTVTLEKRDRSASVKGTVRSEAGTPIPGAVVSAGQTVQGFTKIYTAVTDINGNYSLDGLYSKTLTSLTVGHKNYLENKENSVTTTSETLIYDIVLVATLHYATIKLEYLPLKGGEKVASTIESSDLSLTVLNKDGIVIPGNTTAESGSLKFVPNIQTAFVPGEKVTLKIGHPEISEGKYSLEATVDNSGVVKAIAMPKTLGRIGFESVENLLGYGSLRILIFDSKGNRTGEYNWLGQYFSPYLPSGTYSAILISGTPIADGVMKIADFNALKIDPKLYIKLNSLIVRDGELTDVGKHKVPDASSLQFVTYKSTMNAPDEVAAGELFEISGVIDSAKNGTLDFLTIAQRGDDGDGLITLSAAVIGGKTVTDAKSLVSHGQRINVPEGVDKSLPVSYKFILRASDINFHFFLSANVTIDGKKYRDQVIGSKEIKINKSLTMDIPDRVADGKVNVSGLGIPGETVTIYSNGTALSNVQVNSKGKYQAMISLPGTDKAYSTYHKITVKSGEESKTKNVWNCPKEAVLVDLSMINNQFDNRGMSEYTTVSEVPVGGHSISYFALETTTLQFRAKFVNPSMLDSFNDGVKVRFLIKTNTGTSVIDAADTGNGIFESASINYGYYPPIAVTVLYSSKPYNPAAPRKITDTRANSAQLAALNTQPDAVKNSNEIASGIQKGVDLFAEAYKNMDGNTIQDKISAYFAQDKVQNVIKDSDISAVKVFDYKKGIPSSDKFAYTQAVSQKTFNEFLSALGDGKEFRRSSDEAGKYNLYTRVRYYDKNGNLINLNNSVETSAYTLINEAAVAVETIYCVETLSNGSATSVTVRETTIALPNTSSVLAKIFGPVKPAPILASTNNFGVPLEIFALGESSNGSENSPVVGISFEADGDSMSANTAIGGVLTFAGLCGGGPSDLAGALLKNEVGGEVSAGVIQGMLDLNSALGDGSGAKQIATACIQMETYLKGAYKNLPANSPVRAELIELLHEVQDTRLEAELADIQNDFTKDVSLTGGTVSTVVGGTFAATGVGVGVSAAIGFTTGATSYVVGAANDTRLARLQNRFQKLLGNFEKGMKDINDAIRGGGGSGGFGGSATYGDIGYNNTTGRLSPNFDPSGYIYEAVASNRIKNATVTLYYNGSFKGIGASKLKTIGSENILKFDDSDGLGQANPLISDKDGRYAWNVPEGLWLVKVEKKGYEAATSTNDKAATVAGKNYNWLPVLPPQLDVNIGIISKEAPKVEKVNALSNGVVITFSKYMDTSMLTKDSFTIKLNSSSGKSVPFTLSLPDKEADPKNSKKTYARTVFLKCTLKNGTAVNVSVNSKLKSYAGVSMAALYSKKHTVKPSAQTAGVTASNPGGKVKNMAVVSLSCKTEGAIIYYTTDGKTPTSASKRYTEPLLINKTTVLKAIAISPGHTNSKISSLSYKVIYS